MTIVVGAASIVGLVSCVRWRTPIRLMHAAAQVVLFAGLQWLAFRLSLLPYIATR